MLTVLTKSSTIIATTYVLVVNPAVISPGRRTAFQVMVHSLRMNLERFDWIDNWTRNPFLAYRAAIVAPTRFEQISPHSFPAAPELLAHRHRTSSVRSQSAAGS